VCYNAVSADCVNNNNNALLLTSIIFVAGWLAGWVQELLGVWANQEAGRRERAKKVRDIKYQAFVDMTNNMRKGPGNRNNQSGAPHINIITREPISKEATAMSSYKKDLAQY
jgi:hypothetical protein